MAQTPEKPVLSIADACAYMGVSRDTILRLIHEEGLPAVQFQRLWRIPTKALSEWLLERTRTATHERRATGDRREDATA